jgi:cobalt-zinc-cadmium efflux system membrane fusion protein
MKLRTVHVIGLLGVLSVLSACGSKQVFDPAAGAPPPAKIDEVPDVNFIQVSHPNRFPLTAAVAYQERPSLDVTGVVSADVSRTIPVVSLVSGRVTGLYAHLGDDVKKGQLLMRIQSSDLASGFSDYSKAKADEQLARAQQERAQLLYGRGAIARKDLEVAEDAEQKAQVDLRTTAEHLRIVGGDLDRPSAVIEIRAPASGTIVEQNVTNSSGVKTLDNSPNLFTIADLSHVWILCDVYENQLPFVKLGDTADVKLNSYPDRVFHARVSNIGRVLDPNTRTAKVRLDLANPGIMRVGMFATATFFGATKEAVTAVPATAVLHLHDRDWVYLPLDPGKFRRTEVHSGGMTGNGMQIVAAGLNAGQQVVGNALQLSSASGQ